jgi:hypothetical protein
MNRSSIKYGLIKNVHDFLDEKKQDKMQWFQNPTPSNEDNLNIVRSEASRQFRNIKQEYMKAKIMNLEINVIPRIAYNCTGPSNTLKRVTILDLI